MMPIPLNIDVNEKKIGPFHIASGVILAIILKNNNDASDPFFPFMMTAVQNSTTMK